MKEQAVTLHLPDAVYQWIERARGETGRSIYITRLLQQRIEEAQRESVERAAWLAEGRKQYSSQVCEQTLKVNDEFPVHEE